VIDQGLDSQRTVDYGKGVERIGSPRAQKRSPPLVVGTGARAFNATAMLQPNPAVTGSMIEGHASIKSPLFLALSSRLEKSTNWHSAVGVISHQEAPRDDKVSAPV